jgi:hypothetical protein
MSNVSMPIEVPALTADKLVRNMSQCGSRRCLTGWVDHTFKSQKAQNRALSVLNAKILKKLKGDKLTEFKQYSTSWGTTNRDRCVFYNDEFAGKLSQVANVWNEAMHDLGYGVTKFTAKKPALVKQTKKKSTK